MYSLCSYGRFIIGKNGTSLRKEFLFSTVKSTPSSRLRREQDGERREPSIFNQACSKSRLGTRHRSIANGHDHHDHKIKSERRRLAHRVKPQAIITKTKTSTLHREKHPHDDDRPSLATAPYTRPRGGYRPMPHLDAVDTPSPRHVRDTARDRDRTRSIDVTETTVEKNGIFGNHT